MPDETENVWGQEDEKITREEEQRHGLDWGVNLVEAFWTSPQRGWAASSCVPVPYHTAPVDSLYQMHFPHSSRICHCLAEGTVEIVDEPSLLVFPLLTINSLISPSARQHVLSHPVERRGAVSPGVSVPHPTLAPA